MGWCGGSNKSSKKKPKFNWEPKSTKKSSGTIRKPKDYRNVLHDFNRMKTPVEEYQTCAAIFGSGTVKNFGWTESVEGVHFGSRSGFSGSDRRNKYSKTHTEVDGLYCSYYGEDCVTIDPLGHAEITNAQFKGRADQGSDGSKPGQDKCFQVDSGRLELKDSLIENAVRGVRAKANSIVVLDNVDFVDCKEAVKGDGLNNPRPADPFYNGKAGTCLILIKNCTFYDCDTNAYAADGCEIYFAEGNQSYGKGKRRESGGNIIKGSDAEQKFWDAVDKMKKSSKNEW